LLFHSDQGGHYTSIKFRQKRTLDQLREYDTAKPEAFSSNSLKSGAVKGCKERAPTDQYCLEKKYIKNGYFVVDLRFINDGTVPAQPRAKYDRATEAFDYTEREAFLKDISDEVLREFLGEDYGKFNQAKLILTTRKRLRIQIEVLSADELIELVKNPRLVSVHHIGYPTVPPEEVSF